MKTSDWIVTTPGCRDETSSRQEDKGLLTLSKPLAIERTRTGVRLRNQPGWLELER